MSTPRLSTEQRFQLFLQSASDYGMFFMDVSNVIVEWSAGAERIFGYNEREAIGQSGRMIFTPDDRAAGIPEQEITTAGRDGQANDERWHLRRDGSLVFVIGRMVALKNDAGKVLGFAKIVRDATPHKRLEEALRVSDEQFRATFSQAPLGMVLTDLRGRIVQVNAAFQRLTGWNEADLQGRDALSIATPADREKISSQINALLLGQTQSAVSEKRLQRADGSEVWVQNSAALLRDAEGRPLSMIDLCQDISAQKRSELELEAMIAESTASLRDKTQQMESFCYTVAHDLRSPLRAIAGYAEFLREDCGESLRPKGLEYLERIEASAARLDRLIHDLLGYTRVQQAPLIREEVDLDRVVDRVVDQLARDINGGGGRVDVRRPLGKVRADYATLDHVFLNLISNALKFARPQVPPVVEIYAENREDALRVFVQDNGIGIDPKFHERVFRMFERVHIDPRYPGTGVGLAIVATAMERFGGARGVEPNPAGGSRFWIEFAR